MKSPIDELRFDVKDALFRAVAVCNEKFFTITGEGENDYRIKFNKDLVTFRFENETESSVEILVQKRCP